MKKHKPRYTYDCKRCKFNWCCGYTCACVFEQTLPAPPKKVQNKVDISLMNAGLEPHYINKVKKRILNSIV